LSSDPIPLRREFGILENQYAADWNPNVAHRRLSERLDLRAVDENIGPGFRVDLDRYVKRDHCPRRFIAVDHVRDRLDHSVVTVFEGVVSGRYIDRDRCGTGILIATID